MKCNQCLHYNACMHLIVTEHEELIECEHFLDIRKMIKLPCSVGDVVFVLLKRCGVTEIKKATVKDYYLFNSLEWFVTFSDLWIDIPFTEFGKSVFSTKEAAEQALEV